MVCSVKQLKEDIQNPTIGIAQLISNAYMLAVSLDDESATDWFKNELEGYTSFESIPDYRKLPARCIAIDGNSRQIPVNLPDDAFYDRLKYIPFNLDISQLEKAASKQGQQYIKPIQGRLLNTLQELCAHDYQMGLAVECVALQRILSIVKTKTISWVGKLTDEVELKKLQTGEETLMSSQIIYNAPVTQITNSGSDQSTNIDNSKGIDNSTELKLPPKAKGWLFNVSSGIVAGVISGIILLIMAAFWGVSQT